MNGKSERRPGMAVDAEGGPIYDPSKNVLDLVLAAVQRQDDLRAADRRYYDGQYNSMLETMKIRSEHQLQLDASESARIDSIRGVDVLATATTASQAQAAIQTLAAAQAASAETLRLAVANTATTIASQLQATITEVNKRLSSLEQAAYETRGKSAFADPAQLELLAEVKALREARAVGSGQPQAVTALVEEVRMLREAAATGAGRSSGGAALWGYIIGAVGLLGGLITLAIALMKMGAK